MENKDPFLVLKAVNELKEEIDEVNKKKYLKDSAKRLTKIIETKIRTSFIGALSQFEELIGKELWAHGKDESDCDEDELYWRGIWDKVRTNVLNNGNAQLRALQSELLHYEIKWNRYQIKGGTPNGNNQE